MTGFARHQGQDDTCSWTWEAKTVNGKSRDVRCRLPSGFEGLDQEARGRAAKRIRRGNVSLTLSIIRNDTLGGYRINRDMLDSILGMLPELRQQLDGAAPPSLEGLLSIRGVVEQVEDDIPEEIRGGLERALLEGLDRTLDELAAMRREEGGRLETVLSEQLGTIATLVEEAGRLAATQPATIRQRLKEQIEALIEDVPTMPEERLAQEAAILMTKADVREELDRLAAHIEASRDLMAEDAAIGRKMDFLCQEFNREANTLCSKAADVDLSRVGLELKAVIEQMREQVQNIE